jgi:hypothetical protein
MAADAVIALHLAFILFAVLGGVLVGRWPRLAWLHLPACCWAAALEFWGGTCPLTPKRELAARARGSGRLRDGLYRTLSVALNLPSRPDPRGANCLGSVGSSAQSQPLWMAPTSPPMRERSSPSFELIKKSGGGVKLLRVHVIMTAMRSKGEPKR